MLYSQNNKTRYSEDKKFLIANIKGGESVDPHIQQLPHPFFFWNDKMELYGIYHTLAKDPIPAPSTFIILPDSSIYHTSEILDVLKKLKLFPKSDEEAIKLAALVLYCMDRNDHILKKDGLLFGEYEAHIQNRNKESIKSLTKNSLDKISDPESEKKENYYLVELCINNFESHKYWEPKLSSLSVVSIKIGKDIFEIIDKAQIGTGYFE